MNNLTQYNEKTFENIKHIDEYGNEYWEARELQKVLEYKEWRNFRKVLDKAMITCIQSKINVLEHFVEFNKTIIMPKNATKVNYLDMLAI